LVLSFDNGRAILGDSVGRIASPAATYKLTSAKLASWTPTAPQDTPAVFCELGPSRRLVFCILTGLDSPLSLDATYADSLCSSGEAIRVLQRGQLYHGSPERLIVREIEVFGIVFRNVPAEIGRVNAVGFALLRNLNFTLDFPNKRVRVPDPPQSGQDWFPIDASGLRIVRKEDQLTRIRRIVENSTADVAGVKVDDVIVAVNGTPALEMSRYEVEEVLSKPGTTVHLDLERNGKALTIDVPLEHPFEYPPKWRPRPAPSKDQLEFEKFLEEQSPGKAPAESAIKLNAGFARTPEARCRGFAAFRTRMCCARDILSNRSRGILPRRFFRLLPIPKAGLSYCKEGGRSKTARLRTWPPERRSGCTSAEPYPPSGSGAFWPCDGF